MGECEKTTGMQTEEAPFITMETSDGVNSTNTILPTKPWWVYHPLYVKPPWWLDIVVLVVFVLLSVMQTITADVAVFVFFMIWYFFTFEWFFWFKYISEEERSRSLNERRLRWLSTHTHSEVDNDYTFDAQIRPNSNQPRPVGCCSLTPRFIFWTLWSAGWFILFWSLYILEIPSFHWLGVDYWGTEGFLVLIAWLCYMPRFLSYCNELFPWCCIKRTCCLYVVFGRVFL